MEKPVGGHFLDSFDEQQALQTILEGTATQTGEAFFDALVVNLSQALGTKGALVTERMPRSRRLKTLASWFDGRINHGYEYDFTGTPCETVIDGARYLHVPEGLRNLYPHSKEHREGITSYLGAPLMDVNGEIMGNLAVFDSQPMPQKIQELAIFRIFAARAAAELQRLRAEARLKTSERKYRGIVETTRQGYVLTDDRFSVLDVNNAFCHMVGLDRQAVLGKQLGEFFTNELRYFLVSNCAELVSRGNFEVKGALNKKGGPRMSVLVHGSTLSDNLGGDTGVGLFITDLSMTEKSFALAAEVQKSMLPSVAPRIRGLDIAGRSEPCENIGGDYFDFIQARDAPDRSLTVCVGDMSGHGVDAALLMTSARAFLRMQIPNTPSLTEVVTGLNRHIIAETPQTHHFMTLFVLNIDTAGHRMEWVRAGHEPALLYDPLSNGFKELKGRGLALGLSPAHAYSSNRMRGLSDNQIVVLGTDGIREARNVAGEMFGKKRLYDVIHTRAHKSAQEIIDAVFDTVGHFSQGTIAEDDQTLVVIKPSCWSPEI